MIHRIRIKNFKSIVDVEVNLESVTVLVGKSGTGKSNFIDAIRTLRLILSSQQRLGQVQQSWGQYRPAMYGDCETHFELDFSIAGMNEHFTYELTIAKQGPSQPPRNEKLCLGERILFHQADSHWASEPDLLHVPNAGAPALGRIPSISEIVLAFTALSSAIGCYVFPDNVLSGQRNNQQANGLDDQAVNYLDALRDIISNLQDLHVRTSMIAALQRLNPSVASIELNDIQEPSHVVVGHKFNGKTLALPLARESDGFRRFYAHLLALYQRPPKQTMLFEHPEDGIHPGALSMLAEEFKAAPEDGRGQVVLTTHSPKLLDHFNADQIRVVELDGFATRIGPISGEQHEAIQEDLLDAGDLLTVDPARLESTVSESAGA